MPQRNLTVADRVFVGVATMLVSGAIMWLYTATVAVGDVIIEIAKTQAVMQSQVTDVRAQLSGIYTQQEAEAAHAVIYRTDQDQYRRLDVVEAQLRKLMGWQRSDAPPPATTPAFTPPP